MTQVGESVNVSTIPEGTKKSIVAEVVELEFIDNFKSSIAQTVVSPPHWPATKNTLNESSKAVVFQFDHPGTQKAKIKIKITSVGYSGNGELIGMFKGLEFTGSIPLASGEHVIEVTLNRARI